MRASLRRPMEDEDECTRLAQLARQAWPRVGVAERVFVERLRSRRDSGQSLPQDSHVADAYLAFACELGDDDAISAFDRDYLARVPAMVRRVDNSSALAEEVQQILRARLLVGDGTPKIGGYAGRGSLLGWLKVAAVRCTLELLRARKSERGEDVESEAERAAALVSRDPELDYLREKYAGDFREAFSDALANLDKQQRTVLSLYLADGLNIASIGALYSVHRATVARWIAETREHLFADTRRRLHERLNISETEFQSIVRLVQSQLDVSVQRLLREAALRDAAGS
ncbi:MAG: sigma-70 family RNA polymerase sigma factor [Myxococcales bacterium]|nr:sigma-70 family RNA polymerase sigma factor [Myxococcales bacterium]